MNFLKITSLFLLSIPLLAVELKRNYYIKERDVKLSTIIKNIAVQNDKTLFNLPPSQHIKRIKSNELINILKKYGYSQFTSNYSYIQFNQLSPVDTSKIENYLLEAYKKSYTEIRIKDIRVSPRSYLEKLPKNYSVHLRSQETLSNEGIVSIKSQDHKQIFFNYTIEAELPVYKARKKLERDQELTSLNTTKNSIILDKFRAYPLQNLQDGTLQTKHRIEKNGLITTRDYEPLSLIKRGSQVSVSMTDGTISINFLAKALQDGKYGDRVLVENSQGKRIKVLVTGKNKAELK